MDEETYLVLLRYIAELSDAAGLSEDWADAFDDNLEEEFDPWHTIDQVVLKLSGAELIGVIAGNRVYSSFTKHLRLLRHGDIVVDFIDGRVQITRLSRPKNQFIDIDQTEAANIVFPVYDAYMQENFPHAYHAAKGV